MILKANTFFLFLVFSVFILVAPSCKKAETTSTTDTKPAATIETMHVPAGFLFKTTRDVGINIRTLDNQGNVIPNIRVGVYSDYPEQGGTCFVSGVTDVDGYYKFDYIFPAYLDSVVVATNAIGFANAQKFSVRDGSLSCQLGGNHPVMNMKDGGTFKSTIANVYPMGTYDSQGVPNYLTPTNDPIDASMLQDINATMPEYMNITGTHPQYFAAGIIQDMIIEQASDVWVTFVHEGAGYLNVLGYYKYPTGNPPATPANVDSIHVIFPNVSFSGSGGGLHSGNRVHLGVMAPGTTLGWVLIANGFSGGKITSGISTLYSDKNLNPEPNASLKQHVLLLNDIGRGKFLLSFEDMRRDGGSDNDFNDAVFYVTANPIQGVQTAHLPLPDYTQVDTDHDGISNTFDDYPNDPLKAFDNYYPAKGTFGTLAFEDLWPSKGDYDMNDMILGYSFNQVTNGQNKVVQINATIVLRAMGASYHNGFGIQLPISPSAISSVTGTDLRENYIVRNSNGTEAGQSKATIVVFDNGYKLLPFPGGTGTGVNTTPGMTYVQPDTLHLVINLTSPVALSAIGTPPYNPFLIINMERGKEVHMINHMPTDLANLTYLGTGADDSNPATGRYYVTKNNLPWVLDISSRFDYPIEKSEITKAYLKFIPWVESNGQTNYDWFQDKAGYRSQSYIYTH